MKATVIDSGFIKKRFTLIGMETSLDQIAISLLQAAGITLAVACFWFVSIAVRTKSWWWLLSFVLILPIFAFAYIRRRELKAAGLLLLASLALNFSALIAAGDVLQDQHPNEPSERPNVQWKAAAFVRLHEPDYARVSGPESVRGSG